MRRVRKMGDGHAEIRGWINNSIDSTRRVIDD